jgi:hypothetical protein
MRRLVPLLAASVAVVLLGALALTTASAVRDAPRGTSTRDDDPGRDDAGLGAGLEPLATSPAPALTVPAPVLLDRAEPVVRWAPVARAVVARRAPSASSPVVGTVDARTPEGTENILLVLAGARRAGRLWLRVRLAVLPNGTTGWVPRDAVGGYRFVRTHLVVDRARLTATLLDGGREVFRAPVGVGTRAWPTPAGSFYIRNKLTSYSSATYGPVAFGTSARSSVLTDWPAGGFVGIHGTDHPELLPGRVSHGCIRLRNADILALERLMPVGTPLTVL